MDTHADTHTHEKKKSYEAKIYKKNSFAIIVAINIPITQLLKKKTHRTQALQILTNNY